MDRSIDSIGSCSLDADSTDFSGNKQNIFRKVARNGKNGRVEIGAELDQAESSGGRSESERFILIVDDARS